MSNSTIGLIIGGFIPAVFFAASGIFSKVSTKAGMGVGPYLIMIGLAILLLGILTATFSHNWSFPIKGTWSSFSSGLVWGTGSGLFALALSKYHAPVSQLAPLYNMNTLLVVIFGLIIFSEWKDMEMVKLLTGTVMVVSGSILVSLA
ncbi:MAG: hypothetical protein WC846_01375 [Candidatus Gracilibacteria bacterium]|jgi:transporter family protein